MLQLQCHNEPKMVTKWVLLNFVKCRVLKSIDQIFGKKILSDFLQISAKLKTMSNFEIVKPS